MQTMEPESKHILLPVLHRKTNVLLQLFLLLSAAGFAYSGDTLGKANDVLLLPKKEKAPKHYIRSEAFFSRYGTGFRPAQGNVMILDQRLGEYSFQHYNVGFYAPLMTRAWFRKDSVSFANFHLLFTLNSNTAVPQFTGLDDHRLFKFGMGLRGIYNTGKNWIWFFDASPYSVGDRYNTRQTREARYASILVASWSRSPEFCVRVGITRTFLFGDRLHLPVVGIRWGRLDKMYISVLFPRQVTAAWVINKNFTVSAYSKPFGGLYRFSNSDSIYINPNVKVLEFGRWELTNGLRVDVNCGNSFSFFVAGGQSLNGRYSFSSPDFNNNNKPFARLGPFYAAKVDPALFLHFGISARFGKAKRIAGDRRLYEVIDMNGQFDPGDNNDGPGNTQIPAKFGEKEKLKYRDVSDLFDTNDLY
jgi:hypothetical protein